MQSRPRIALRCETERTGVEDRSDHVAVALRDRQTGETRKATARWVLGLDGANSVVRESLGSGQMDLGFEADWLVVDGCCARG